MMNFRQIKNQFKLLAKTRFRWIVAFAGTIEQSIKNKSLVFIYLDSDGDWHNHRKSIRLISPELNVTSRAQLSTNVIDLWCYCYKPKLGDTVVDIGAGIGDEAVIFSEMVGVTGQVLPIEAHPRTFSCLMKTLSENNISNALPLNCAISDFDGEINISNGENYLSNTTQRISKEGELIQARTLSNILRENNISSIDFLKMNIEGAEVNALEGMAEYLGNIKNIVISCHDFKANRGEGDYFRTFDAIYAILKSRNFIIDVRKNDTRPEVPYYIYAKNN